MKYTFNGALTKMNSFLQFLVLCDLQRGSLNNHWFKQNQQFDLTIACFT